MGTLWMLVWLGLVFVALGIWQLVTPLDVLWERRKQYWQARGLTPERTDAWERSAGRGGYF